MTTGTPPTEDRGAAVLAECAAEIKAGDRFADPGAVRTAGGLSRGLGDRLQEAGVDSLGMHLEAWDEGVRE